jgi:hypothetical protein
MNTWQDVLLKLNDIPIVVKDEEYAKYCLEYYNNAPPIIYGLVEAEYHKLLSTRRIYHEKKLSYEEWKNQRGD